MAAIKRTKEMIDPEWAEDEYTDPEWAEDGKDEEWADDGRQEFWPETGADPEWPEDKQEFWQDTGSQDTDDWMNVDIYEDRYPEEEVNQEKAAVRRKR